MQESITKQYRNGFPKMLHILARNTTAKSLLDTMRFCYESEN